MEDFTVSQCGTLGEVELQYPDHKDMEYLYLCQDNKAKVKFEVKKRSKIGMFLKEGRYEGWRTYFY